MYKIVIDLKQKNEYLSSLKVYNVINKDTTKIEKVTASLLQKHIQKALNEFNEELNKNDDFIILDDKEYTDLLEDLLDNLKDLEKTMKDNKKED